MLVDFFGKAVYHDYERGAFMHVTGIITEYNPFHKGHAYHIAKTREQTNCDVLIAVMSGNFVQRGEPAIYDKWQRAQAAVMHGCNLVLELPFLYATQSAENFAKGAVKVLSLANVQDLVFGSESNDLKQLNYLAEMDTAKLEAYMKNGYSPSASYGMLYGDRGPNDILGINYIKAAKSAGIRPQTILRTNSYHDESLDHPFVSASAIRKAILENRDIQEQTMLNTAQYAHTLHSYYPLIQTLLLTLSPEYLRTLFLMDEGIENRLIKAAQETAELDEFLNACISRRYTRSRLRRTLIHLLHQTTKLQADNMPELSYIRMLAYDEIGKSYLKQLRKDVIIASRFNQIPDGYRQMELKAAHVYAYPLAAHDKKAAFAQELQPPIACFK